MSEVTDIIVKALANKLRQIMQVDVEFEKLSTDDLRKLLRVVTSVPLMSQIEVRALRANFNERVMDKPVRELLKPGVLQKELAGAEPTDDGPFGLGLASRALKALKGDEKVVGAEATEKTEEAAPVESPGSAQP
jgi:hypothetical protein